MVERGAGARQWAADLLLLVRWRVSLMVGVSAAFGYVLRKPVAGLELAQCFLGVMLLAWAASACNQWQERELDGKMPRTANRPLPGGRLDARTALAVSLIALAACAWCLWRAGKGSVLFIPLVLALYNGVYTPLKQRTSLSLLVGALAGALPPVVGWMAAGGDARDPGILVVYGIYVLWQVPHFWLRADRERESYRSLGLPLPAVQLGGYRAGRLLVLWFRAYAAALLMLPLFPMTQSAWTRIALALVGIGVFVGAGLLCSRKRERGSGAALRLVDGSLVAVVGLLVLAVTFP